MTKQKSKKLIFVRTFGRLPVVAIAGLLVVSSVAWPQVRNLSAQNVSCSSISDCEQQIQSNNQAVDRLQNEATSYQDALSKLNSQIYSIQKQISISQTKQANLETQIKVAQNKLDQQKAFLRSDIKSMYVNGQMSTVEMLATSKNLSDFVDAETYRGAVQTKIQSTLDQITALQNKLKTQKTQVDQLLVKQQVKQAQLASAKAQQRKLLNYNQSQQAAYNAETAQNQQKLQQLIDAQRLANQSTNGGYYFLRFPGKVKRNPMNGSYPYANWPFSMSTAPGCTDGDGPDQWGYCTRQCVSYAAWAVVYSRGYSSSNPNTPIGYGNAKDWVAAARWNGIPVYSTPQPGDIAIDTAGYWGHAMYVEAVSGNQIYVAQYNQQLTGQFSTQWRTWE